MSSMKSEEKVALLKTIHDKVAHPRQPELGEYFLSKSCSNYFSPHVLFTLAYMQ